MSDVVFNPGEPQYQGSYQNRKQSFLMRLAMKVTGSTDEAKANTFLVILALVLIVAAVIIYVVYA